MKDDLAVLGFPYSEAQFSEDVGSRECAQKWLLTSPHLRTRKSDFCSWKETNDQICSAVNIGRTVDSLHTSSTIKHYSIFQWLFPTSVNSSHSYS